MSNEQCIPLGLWYMFKQHGAHRYRLEWKGKTNVLVRRYSLNRSRRVLNLRFVQWYVELPPIMRKYLTQKYNRQLS